jgi:ADP-ribose pyrophosphatase YjhB (NUDIX family)
MEEKDYTLIFCRREHPIEGTKEILLGMKKRGFGVGKWNGFGGKIELNESIKEGALRELEEESSLISNDIKRVGYLVFKMIESNKLMKVHVFELYFLLFVKCQIRSLCLFFKLGVFDVAF